MTSIISPNMYCNMIRVEDPGDPLNLLKYAILVIIKAGYNLQITFQLFLGVRGSLLHVASNMNKYSLTM